MGLGRKIRELREEMDLSQAQLATDAQVSQGYLCQLERKEGKNPSAAILLQLASALYVDPHELLEAAGYPCNRSAANRRADGNYRPKVDLELLKFLAGLSQEQQRYILLLLESMEKRPDALPR